MERFFFSFCYSFQPPLNPSETVLSQVLRQLAGDDPSNRVYGKLVENLEDKDVAYTASIALDKLIQVLLLLLILLLVFLLNHMVFSPLKKKNR